MSEHQVVPGTAAKLAPPSMLRTDGLGPSALLEEQTERRVDAIEMIGEEEAAGLAPSGASEVSPGMRYLHSSRTINQLVTDRNRAVGVYLAVASLLWTGLGAFLNAKPGVRLLVPIELIQLWCLPVTFGVLTVLALFVGFLLIRTRIGLIYEVAKMNVLLGMPVGRVKRVNPLSIFFIMHLLISTAGGLSCMLFVFHLLYSPLDGRGHEALSYSVLAGLGFTLLLVLVYIGTVLHTTADKRLESQSGK